VFEDNDTAYMALDLIEGADLLDIIDTGRVVLEPPKVQAILLRLLDAVGYMHDQNILHRDISPDNILLNTKGEPVLIDFGSAREDASRATRVLTGMLMVKDGYSPQEFYIANSRQLPCSDLYALGATFYHVVSGAAPPDSQTRIAALATGQPDPCQPLAQRFARYDPAFLAAIDTAMALFPGDRVQSAEEWACLIDPSRRQAAFLANEERTRDIELAVARFLTDATHLPLAEPETAIIPAPAAPPPPPRVLEYIGFDDDDDDQGDDDAADPSVPSGGDPFPLPEDAEALLAGPDDDNADEGHYPWDSWDSGVLSAPRQPGLVSDPATARRSFDWKPPPPAPSIAGRTARLAFAGLLIGSTLGILAPFAENALAVVFAPSVSVSADEAKG
jgi:serine/threonine protein kinase